MINRYIRRNHLINDAYSKLYQDMPDNRWAGIAAIFKALYPAFWRPDGWQGKWLK